MTVSQSTAAMSILVVDDETLIAMLMEDALLACGCNVIGPAGAVASAMRLVEDTSHEIDGALLDINLRGELVYPVADALISRQVPFAFITGYSRRQIDPRYAGLPAFTKPVPITAIEGILQTFDDCRRRRTDRPA